MAGPQPVYQAKDYSQQQQEQYKKAFDASNPYYQGQVQNQNNSLSLYQQQLQNYQKQLADQQTKEQAQIDRSAQMQTGKVGASTAARGLYNSSVRDNAAQNIARDQSYFTDTLRSDIANRGQAAQDTYSQQQNTIQGAIQRLLQEQQDRASSNASDWVTQRRHDDEADYARSYQAWQDQVAMEQAAQQRAAEEARWQKEYALRSSQAAGINPALLQMRNENLGNFMDAFNKIKEASAGKSISQQQNAMYDWINSNKSYMKNMGVDPQQFWDEWQRSYNQWRNVPQVNPTSGGGLNFGSLPQLAQSAGGAYTDYYKNLAKWLTGKK